MSVAPSAIAAHIKAFSVPPTVEIGKRISPPLKRLPAHFDMRLQLAHLATELLPDHHVQIVAAAADLGRPPG